MKFDPPLEAGRLIKRYKRFLADVDSPRGPLTLHCANTGAMTGCGSPGDRIHYRYAPSPKRKLPGSWELTETVQGHFICINTARANQLVAEALAEKRIPELAWATEIRAEVRCEQGSRIDFLLSDGNRRCWLEVKSVTLLKDNGLGAFPDTVSERAKKHLDVLAARMKEGDEAALLFAALHTGIEQVTAAADIDPAYAQRLTEVAAEGLKVLAVGASITPGEMRLDQKLKAVL
ncbi:DNA/RNA nuclease SfsA [Gallaecimonas sp. GXIMD4217]|uniref:DNA/RNA nuclease SfsA n=1 Tax=Gallaecimonas sp. GXIMD4217 TaxID=3131927 RepID=UPI00311B1E75